MVEFFGDIDKNVKGEKSSTMPSWYDDIKIDHLEEEVAKKERQLKRHQILPENRMRVEQDIENKKRRIKEIKASKPRLNGGQKDMVSKAYFDLKNKIAESMPTKREELEGYVNPRDELNRCKTNHIAVDRKVAESCGMKTVNGKVTGDDAVRMFRIFGKALGENTNVRKIQREGKSESYRTMEDLTKKILEKAVKAG